jgi:predicted phage baseplate assembly protein
MPLVAPNLDDRDFEQLLDEAKRRIPVHTPEWTNFEVESDPGVTLVQLFAFLAESLLYRANRVPDRDRLKFLQLLGVPLQPPAPADGLVVINNERGPVQPLPLAPGVVVSAGAVDFLTIDGVNVLPVEGRVYYKRQLSPQDPSYADYQAQYESVVVARAVADAAAAPADGNGSAPVVQPSFYETTELQGPTLGGAEAPVDLASTSDGALYVALLAPKNVLPDDARTAIANQTLSIGVVPALAGDVPPLQPLRTNNPRAPVPSLVYELADVAGTTTTAAYRRLRLLRQPDVLTSSGVVQVELPEAAALQTWAFADPTEEGSGDYPPKIDDSAVAARLVTWLRLRLPRPAPAGAAAEQADNHAEVTWVGINAARVVQAVPVVNELLGQGNGEPDQAGFLANRPVLPSSPRVVLVDATGAAATWRLTDDLLSAGPNDPVYTLDPESGGVQFGDGLRGMRPTAGSRIYVSYKYGGGTQGNVGVGAINATRDPRLQGGYTVENPVATSGGSAGDTQADGERQIPLVLRHRDRLVTAQDFSDIVYRTPGVDVGRVEVLPLFAPGTPPVTDAAGVVTVMVVPSTDPVRPLWPTPDRLFLSRVCDYLDPRRLVTTEVYVRGPNYVSVYVSVGLQVSAGYFPDVVRQTADDRLHGYLSSLPPGGPRGQGWPLGKPLLRKDLEAVVTRVPGVDYVDSLEMGVGTPQDVAEYDLGGLDLPVLVGLSVREGSAEPIATIFNPPSGPAQPGVTLVPIPVVKTKC